ncbi:MAG TPA: hypothetical protein VHI13_09655 [Candidatus Kapabacteria bacterium]|nr:hypothetical protein [Candidatus Kapabacteria bacterium]
MSTMKTFMLATVPVIMLPWLLCSCTTAEIARGTRLSYDMAHDQFSTSPPGAGSVNEGDMVSLELTNINPFVYDVAINQHSVTYNTSVPPMLKLPLFENQQLMQKGAPVIASSSEELTPEQIQKENPAAVSHFADLYTAFRQKYATFEAFATFDNYLYSALRRPFVDEEHFKEDLGKHLSEVAGGQQLSTKADFLTHAETLFGDVGAAYFAMAGAQSKLEAADKARVKDVFTSATAIYNELQGNSLWAMKVGNTADVYFSVMNTPFRFYSFKTQAKGEAVRFEVEGRRKESTDLSGLEGVRPFSLDYTVPVTGGWKIDFSAGIFFSNLVNDQFSLKDDNGSRSILKKKSDVANYGPGALMHVYYKPIGLGLSLGAFTNNFTNVQYLLGPSIMFGGSNRFCINGGATLGKVTRLADGLEVGATIRSADSDLNTVLTTERLELGWFVGFSYNFTAGL